MIFTDYNELSESNKRFKFTAKTKLLIDKILLEILVETSSGDKLYEKIESIPKILLPKELMKFYFPAPIPEEYLNGGNRAFRFKDEKSNNMSENMDILPRDMYAEELEQFFKALDSIRYDKSDQILSFAYAALTNENVVEDSNIFDIRNKYIAQINNKKAYLFSPELIDSLYIQIVKELAIKRDKELVKAFLYTESILFLNLIHKSNKLQRSYGYIINSSFYKAYSMTAYAIKYSKILFGRTQSKPGDFKPFDVFKAKLKRQPKEYGMISPYLDYMFNKKDDEFFENFSKCIEKGRPKLNSSGEEFLIFMGVDIDTNRTDVTLWQDLAIKILAYKREI
jgi:hypothetical protein